MCVLSQLYIIKPLNKRKNLYNFLKYLVVLQNIKINHIWRKILSWFCKNLHHIQSTLQFFAIHTESNKTQATQTTLKNTSLTRTGSSLGPFEGVPTSQQILKFIHSLKILIWSFYSLYLKSINTYRQDWRIREAEDSTTSLFLCSAPPCLPTTHLPATRTMVQSASVLWYVQERAIWPTGGESRDWGGWKRHMGGWWEGDGWMEGCREGGTDKGRRWRRGVTDVLT